MALTSSLYPILYMLFGVQLSSRRFFIKSKAEIEIVK